MACQNWKGKTELAILNGANLALIGEELVQFTNAEFLGKGSYKLSGLLRGRAGTENKVSTHASNEDFVLINNAVLQEDMSNSLINLERLYKPVSVGLSLDEAQNENFTYGANSLKPYSPVHIKGVRNVSGDLNISWVRRGRINATWQDNIDVPLIEANEIYEIDILDGNDQIIKTINNITQANFIYNQADQITDFGQVQSSIKVNIYQYTKYQI